MKRNRLILAAGLVLVASPACVSIKRDTEAAKQRTDVAIELANGLTYRRADLAGHGGSTRWWISLGVARNQTETDAAAGCSLPLGLESRLINFEFPGSSEGQYSEVVAGDFSTRAQAESYLNGRQLGPKCTAQIKASGLYPSDKSHPTVIHVLTVDPIQFRGELIAARGAQGPSGVSRPSVLMQSKSAIAATNGGFFVMEDTDGIVGESTGISVLNGSLESEATRGRPWVEITNRPRTRVKIRQGEPKQGPELVAADGRRMRLDGINRKPGLLRNCGALLDKSFDAPVHDVTCKPEDELIAVTQNSGLRDHAQTGQIAYELRADGTLQLLGDRVQSDQSNIRIIASGRRRSELQSFAQKGLTFRLSLGEFEDYPRPPSVFAVNGGPALVSKGRPLRRADVQGWPFFRVNREQAGEIHKFVDLRAPRTALGTTASGQIILVVVDGWRYRTDKGPQIPMNGGATLEELTNIMLQLGTVEAINLDGGGSSVMAFQGAVVSNPSDDQGERPVGDSLLLMPGG
jgi:hypothetical protein